MLASCAENLKLLDWDSGKCLESISPSIRTFKSYSDISWSNDGSHLLVVPNIGKSFLIQQDSLTSKKEYINIGGIISASFSKSTNSQVALGTVTGKIYLYDSTNQTCIESVPDLPLSVHHVKYGAEDAFLIACCGNGQIFLYDTNYVINSSYYLPRSKNVTSLAVPSKNKMLFSAASGDGIVAAWDVNTGKRLMTSELHVGQITDIAFSLSDEVFTSVGRDGGINIYDLRATCTVFERKFETAITSVAFCPNDIDVAIATNEGKIISLDMRNLKNSKFAVNAHDEEIRKISFNISSTNVNDFRDNDNEVVNKDELINSNDLDGGVGDGGIDETVGTEMISVAVCSNDIDALSTTKESQIISLDIQNLINSKEILTVNELLTDNHLESQFVKLQNELRNDINTVFKGVNETMKVEFSKIRLSMNKKLSSMGKVHKDHLSKLEDIFMEMAKYCKSDEL